MGRERAINEILNIVLGILFGLLIMGIFGGFANAEPYQIPDRHWESAQNCLKGQVPGKHYMQVMGKDLELKTFCMKAPTNLLSREWDNAIALALVRIADTDRTLSKVTYLDVSEIGEFDKSMVITLSDARTGEEYRRVFAYVP
jgi:hypothetical protein